MSPKYCTLKHYIYFVLVFEAVVYIMGVLAQFYIKLAHEILLAYMNSYLNSLCTRNTPGLHE